VTSAFPYYLPVLMLTKPSAELTLFDTLSRLTFLKATTLLGPDGKRLITENSLHVPGKS
jgi:hypothetical protein